MDPWKFEPKLFIAEDWGPTAFLSVEWKYIQLIVSLVQKPEAATIKTW